VVVQDDPAQALAATRLIERSLDVKDIPEIAVS
jgi:hypothetical protein